MITTPESAQERMDEAVALVDDAISQLLDPEHPDADNRLFPAVRARTVRTMLEEAGAWLGPPTRTNRSVEELVQRAATVLDDIDPAERPTRLLPARGELTILLLEVGTGT